MEPAAEQPGDFQMSGSRVGMSPPQWSRLLNSRVTSVADLVTEVRTLPQWSRLLNSRVTFGGMRPRPADHEPQWSRLLNSRVTLMPSQSEVGKLKPQWSRLLNSRVTRPGDRARRPGDHAAMEPAAEQPGDLLTATASASRSPRRNGAGC